MRRFNIALALSTLLLATITAAQQAPITSVPNLIRYSGSLKDAQGAPLSSSTVGITFGIYNQQDGGAAVWMETQNVTTDAAGNYSVLLGSTTAAGLPGDLFSQQEQRWLGVQVQGEAEQPRVLMVSVPYALKAHEADTLGGRSVSDFVLANGGATAANNSSNGGGAVSLAANDANGQPAASGVQKGQVMAGPTNFSGSTGDQIVSVTQLSTGYAIAAQADSKAIVGTATAPSATAYGVQGVATGTAGVGLIGTASSTTGFTYGLRGTSSSSSGTGVRGIAVATSGSTVGISGYVNSPSGTAAIFNNAAGGNIIVGQNNGAAKFAVDGGGNVNALGTFTGNGSGLTGIQFTQLSGILQDQQFQGEYDSQINLLNNLNNFSGAFNGTYVGNGSGLMGVMPASGSSNYIQNNNGSPQTGASFNIDGFATVGQNLLASAVTTATTYQIGPQPGQNNSVLSIGNNPNNNNVFLGIGAGGNYPGSGTQNTFSGYQAGYNNNGSSANTFTGAQAGYSTTYGQSNTFTGASAGTANTSGTSNSYYGFQAGSTNTTGMNNSAFGFMAGNNNATGDYNIYIGSPGQSEENRTIRIGAPNLQAAAYMAGIYGNPLSGGLPVVINSSGQLGTGPAGGSGVTSWNGRTGAVTPQTGDYSFSMISGTLSPLQIPAGSTNYIQNGTTQQSNANFDIGGNGSANSFVSATTYQIGSSGAVVSIGSPADNNLFLGVGAGLFNNAGSGANVFAGFQAGYNNATGLNNSFYGYQAGVLNTSGSDNVFIGLGAGGSNTTGQENTFSGNGSGASTTTGMANTFYGTSSGLLVGATAQASYNIFLGWNTGSLNPGGTVSSNNIYIGNLGTSSGESDVIRIGGDVGGGQQLDTYIQGIYNSSNEATAQDVCVGADGKIFGNPYGPCVVSSSRRFKDQIADMGDSSSKLFQLRPVTFFYKPQYDNGMHLLQYGLIAEEVADIFPEMAAYDKDGQPSAVRYQMLAPMLLNELQKEHAVVMAQQDELHTQLQQIAAQEHEIEGLRQQLQMQNASLQERLSRLEKLADSQAQTARAKIEPSPEETARAGHHAASF